MCTGVFIDHHPQPMIFLILFVTASFVFHLPIFLILYPFGDYFNVNLLNSSPPLYDKIDMLCNSFSFTQAVDSPTHISHSAHPSLIDLVFVSDTYHVFHIVTPSRNLQILIIMA